MTDLTDLYQKVAPSIASIVYLDDAGNRLSSGTGFLVAGHLVTCAHVLKSGSRPNLEVRFPHAVTGQADVWRYPRFSPPPVVRGFSAEQSYDYVIIEPPKDVTVGESLLIDASEPLPGLPVSTLGFPFDDPHLTLHSGFVSSVYDSGVVARMIKLDMSVNPSNSGGPLIRPSDGKVIGVVARKATGLSIAFDELMNSFDANIALFNSISGTFGIAGIDVGGAFGASQMQLRQVALEMKRSANVGIGYAVLASALALEPALAQ